MCSFRLTRIDHISSLSVRESKNTSHIFAQLLFFSLHHCAAPFLYRLKWQVIVSENQSYNFYTLLAAFLKWWKQFGPFKTSGPHLSMFWEIKWPANQKIISDCGQQWDLEVRMAITLTCPSSCPTTAFPSTPLRHSFKSLFSAAGGKSACWALAPRSGKALPSSPSLLLRK